MSSRWVSKPPVGSMLDFGHPLSQGLVGCWLLNEGGGSVVNDIGRKIKALSAGTLSWRDLSVGGIIKHNPYLVYEGSVFTARNLIIQKAYTNLFRNGRHTIMASVMNRTSHIGQILAADDGTNRNFQFRIDALNCDFIIFVGNAAKGATSTGNLLSVGTPRIVTGTNDGVVASVYIDGVFNASVSAVGNCDTDDTEVSIGGRNTGTEASPTWAANENLNARISFLYYWSRSLSPSEIKSLYESPYQFIKGPSTITYFTAPAVGGWTWGGEVKNIMVA